MKFFLTTTLLLCLASASVFGQHKKHHTSSSSGKKSSSSSSHSSKSHSSGKGHSSKSSGSNHSSKSKHGKSSHSAHSEGHHHREHEIYGHKILTYATNTAGADQTHQYFNYLLGKSIGMVVNQTSVIGSTQASLVDTLRGMGLRVSKIFGPEHGFRGDAANGANVDDAIDPKTKLPVISLYGKHYKPTKADMQGVDVMIFDVQDVGARFYTYLSTLQYVMEACAENNKELLILDRPNPNGNIVDGPVLDTAYSSFVGMQPIPIAYGMTIGEYAQMLNGEGWLKNHEQCVIKVIKVTGYRHDAPYELPIAPSPNLNTQQSILLYPSVCLFEGTNLSLGRGTMSPFLEIGHPSLKGQYPFSFTPQPIKGMSDEPPLKGETCYGLDLHGYDVNALRQSGRIDISLLLSMYKAFPDKSKFFNGYFTKLAGGPQLQKQIEQGMTEAAIRASWEPALAQFKEIRRKYLLYP